MICVLSTAHRHTMTQTNVQYVLQTTEWRHCSRWVNISSKKKPRVGRTEFLWHDRSLYPGRTEGIHLPVQFTPEVGPPADDGRHGWPSIGHQHPVPLRRGWNPDGTQTGKEVADFPFNHPECCVASLMKTSGSTLEVLTAILPKI